MTTADVPSLQVVPWLDPDLMHTARHWIAEEGIVRITGFPASAHEFIRFLSLFGAPVAYYGDGTGTHPEDGAIWRIRYEPGSAARGETHALAGPLSVHSSQSLRDPRPRFFSMLMVNRGWGDSGPGPNGESVLAPWRSAVRRLRQSDPWVLDRLAEDVPFPDGSRRPVLYELPDARSDDDLGVRLKGEQIAFLEAKMPDDIVTRAVRTLIDTAEATAIVVPLASKDLVLLDNNRWGHGRLSVIGHRSVGGSTVLNPRELWSATAE